MKPQEELIGRMAAVPYLSRGKLCRKGTSKTGRAFYNLQYWHGGRNNVRYVGEAEYPVYAEAVAGYREFMRLVEEYVVNTGVAGGQC